MIRHPFFRLFRGGRILLDGGPPLDVRPVDFPQWLHLVAAHPGAKKLQLVFVARAIRSPSASIFSLAWPSRHWPQLEKHRLRKSGFWDQKWPPAVVCAEPTSSWSLASAFHSGRNPGPWNPHRIYPVSHRKLFSLLLFREFFSQVSFTRQLRCCCCSWLSRPSPASR